MKRVYEQLKFSYLHLQDEGLRQCLLYCALYPEDLDIGRKELIEHLVADDIIEGRTREAEFDKGHAMLNKLENYCLLEGFIDNQNNRWVKMHDLIRDMALQITRTRFLVKAGINLREFPTMEKWTENLEKVSLMHNFLSEIPSAISPRCHSLSTLLLSSTHMTQIRDIFFLHMNALQVLNLSDTNIVHLPNSLSNLENLTTLSLRGCTRLKYIPSLSKLVSLRKLDLNHTGIKDVPDGMEMLTKLKYLNLYAENLKMLPAGILPKFPNLQFLHVYGGSKTLKLKGEEVAYLRKLETFAGQFYSLNDLTSYTTSLRERPPKSYFIRVGASLVTIEEEKESFGKVIHLKNCFACTGRKDTIILPEDTETLVIEEYHNVSSLVDLPHQIYTGKLKRCRIFYCKGMEFVILPSSFIFASLESLELHYLDNLQAFFNGGAITLAPDTFSVLRTLKISSCRTTRKLFSDSQLLHLRQVEELKVWYCPQMEEIIATEEVGESSRHYFSNETKTLLPKLKHLSLRELPKLKSIYGNVLPCSSLQVLQVIECTNLKRIPISFPQHGGGQFPPPALERISASKKWWEALEWDHLSIKSALEPFLQTNL
ncbi:hypothetical protein L6164_018261 [Bauhinia variegata]|nr:hypothetical protein L6164_018261 [Bauhinia variegata]